MSRFNDARIINDVEVKEIFIAAITTPTPSTKQIETSCTAGFDREGRWVRVYPVPLRLIEARTGNGYRKYQWVRFNTFAASADDKRPESRKCSSDFQCITEPSKSWEEKKSICLGKGHRIYTDFSELYDEAFSEKMTSLAVFKPASIIRCHAEDISQDEIAEILEKQKKVIAQTEQMSLFEEDFRFVQAEPARIRLKYEFTDIQGKKHDLQILDWEAYMLYRNVIQNCSHEEAKAKVVAKYEDIARTKDVYLFLGTRKDDHMKRWGNPFSIIGVFHPPKDYQLGFDFE